MGVYKKITVNADVAYDVLVGNELLNEITSQLDDSINQVAIIYPAKVSAIAKKVSRIVKKSGQKVIEISIPDAENAKTSKVLEKCWDKLGSAKFTRSDLIIGVGGGATTDLVGFVAATWLRGIKFISVSTTLLGMVDAAVGGKTGINTKHGKNLVGAFYNPSLVLCDIDNLKNLKKYDFTTGMAEVIKCGFIADERILEIIEKYPDECKKFDGIEIPELIARSIQVKAEVVGKDFRETSSSKTGREILNYGHTLAHAIEKIENYKWRHGDAVSVGMVFAAELALAESRLSPEVVERHRTILSSFGLPIKYKDKNFKKIIEIMALDKKSRGATLRFVILEAIAKPARLENPSFKTLSTAWKKVTK